MDVREPKSTFKYIDSGDYDFSNAYPVTYRPTTRGGVIHKAKFTLAIKILVLGSGTFFIFALGLCLISFFRHEKLKKLEKELS